jgi:histone H3/H4
MPPSPTQENESSDTQEASPPIKTIHKRKSKHPFAIPRVPFRRLVQEIADSYKSDLRMQQAAIDALQESAELMLAERFGRCAELAELCKLDTIRDEHWRFVQEEAVPC